MQSVVYSLGLAQGLTLVDFVMQMQLLRVTDFGGTVSVGDIVVAVEPVKAVVSHLAFVLMSACCQFCGVIRLTTFGESKKCRFCLGITRLEAGRGPYCTVGKLQRTTSETS